MVLMLAFVLLACAGGAGINSGADVAVVGTV